MGDNGDKREEHKERPLDVQPIDNHGDDEQTVDDHVDHAEDELVVEQSIAERKTDEPRVDEPRVDEHAEGIADKRADHTEDEEPSAAEPSPPERVADSDDVQPKKLKTALAVFSTFLVLFCLGAGVVLGMINYVLQALSPTEADGTVVQIEIPAGSNSTKIARILEEHGIIRDYEMFGYYLRYKNEGRTFKAGLYEMETGMSLDDIIAKLNAGDTVKIEMVRFTIPEGFTVVQMADRLSEEGLVDRDQFMQLLQQPERFTSPLLAEIPDDPNLVYKLEGYLFPETYEMKKGSSEQEMIQRMIDELERKLATLPVGWESQLETLGISLHDLLTIASMIEREVVVDHERAIVSGIIQNRLNIPMLLQIDATVQYALGEHRDTVLLPDLEVDSPYNTYTVLGLPPGPIAAPGLSAIRAALYPEETEYLYYVTKKDGTYEHYFAKTYEEHLRNKKMSENN